MNGQTKDRNPPALEHLPLDAVLQEIFQTRDRSMEQVKAVAI
jgi:hypothetical protein